MSENYKDKLLGMVQGVFLGDSLGAPHEFWHSRNLVFTGKLKYKPKMVSRWQGTRYGFIGQWTDDSEMTLTLLRSLAKSKGKYDRNQTILMYMNWANSKPIGLGNNTKSLMYGIKTLKGYEKRWNKLFGPDVVRNMEPESNGSLMRASPLAVLSKHHPVIEDCDITNPTELNNQANLVYVKAVRMALQGYSKEEIIEEAKKNKNETIQMILAHAFHPEGISPDYPSEEEIQPYTVSCKLKGWVAIALYVTFHEFAFAKDFRTAIQNAIKKGGDTDTNAAITGGLCGAYYGSKKIMKDKITKENWKIIIGGHQDGDYYSSNFVGGRQDGDYPRSEEYTPHDLEELVSEIVKYYPL